MGPQQASRHQLGQIARGGGLGGAGELDVLLRIQAAQEAAVSVVQQPLHHLALPLVQRSGGRRGPEACFREHRVDDAARLLTGQCHLLRKPHHPGRRVGAAALSGVECFVIAVALGQQLPGQPIQPHRRLVMLCHRQVDDGAADAAVAVFKRVYGLEPQVRQRSPCHAVHRRRPTRWGGLLVEPREERRHLVHHLRGGRRFVVHHFLAWSATDDLHGVGMAAVTTDLDAADAAGATREQSRLPAPQPVVVQRLIKTAGGVVDHRHLAVGMAVLRSGAGQAQAAHDRRSHGIRRQPLALDGGRGDGFFLHQGLHHRDIALQTNGLRLAFKPPLHAMRIGQHRAGLRGVEGQRGPVRLLLHPA